MKNLSEVKLNAELLAQAEECATPEELMALAKAQSIELSSEEAEQYMSYLTRDLTEEELSQVAGGGVDWSCVADGCVLFNSHC